MTTSPEKVDAEQKREPLSSRVWRRTRLNANVDWIFLKSAIGVTLGFAPFLLVRAGTIGALFAGVWGVCYVLLTLPLLTLLLMVASDAWTVTSGKPARFMPIFKYFATRPELQQQLEKSVPPAITAYAGIAAAVGTFISPLTLPMAVLASYVEINMDAAPQAATPPMQDTIVEVRRRAIEARTYIQVQRRPIHDIEITGTHRVQLAGFSTV